MSAPLNSGTVVATLLPAPVVVPDYKRLADATNTQGTHIELASGFVQFTRDLTKPSNRNAQNLDMILRFLAAGTYCILDGLALSATGADLNVSVAAGHLALDGLMECVNAATVPVINGANPAYLWVVQGQQQPVVTYNTTPPAAKCALIGLAYASGGVITALDTSGVIFWKGFPWRRTGDQGAPGDAPAAQGLITRTRGGLYLWDGVKHTPLSAYDLDFWVGGKPATNAVLYRKAVNRPVVFENGLPQAAGVCATPATALTTFNVQRNGVTFAQMQFQPGQQSAVFASTPAQDQACAAGDMLAVIAPGVQDTTLADIAVTLSGVVG